MWKTLQAQCSPFPDPLHTGKEGQVNIVQSSLTLKSSGNLASNGTHAQRGFEASGNHTPGRSNR